MVRRFLVLVVCALLCFNVCGCRTYWDEAAQPNPFEQVESTGHGVNLWPTSREDRAGYR